MPESFFTKKGSGSEIVKNNAETSNKVSDLLKESELLGLKNLKNRLALESLTKVNDKEIFYPEEELFRIRMAPRKEKRALLEEFKETFVWQKKGIAEMSARIEKVIRANPDLSGQDLKEVAEPFCDRYRLPGYMRRMLVDALSQYLIKHEAVAEAHKNFPNDQELFRYVFGRKPLGRIEVIEGPMTLCFRCYDMKDYALIRSGGFKRGFYAVSAQDIAEAEESGAVSLNEVLPKNLQDAILAENVSEPHSPEYQEKTLTHEEQHAIKGLFREVFKPLPKHSFLERYNEAKSSQARRMLLRRYLLQARKHSEIRAKDEILAYMKSGYFTPSQILQFLMKPKEEEGLYDYSLGTRRSIESTLIAHFPKDKDLVEAMIREIFILDYSLLLVKSIVAFASLQKEGYGVEWITALLSNVPLNKWNRIVKGVSGQNKV
jgi:hypothetical protein